MGQITPPLSKASVTTSRRRGCFLRGCLTVVVVSLVLACWWYVSRWQRIPTIEGRVVDARTGVPIAGVLIQKWLYQPPPLDFVDSRSEKVMKGSTGEATTDADGRFAFPGRWAFRTVAMGWMVWSPGYMPDGRCYKRDEWLPGWCPAWTGFYNELDPWVETTFTDVGKTIQLDVRLHRPTLEGARFVRRDPAIGGFRPYVPDPGSVDPWGEYFRRLRIWVELRRLQEEDFFQEAQRYLEQHSPSEDILSEVARVEGTLGGYRGDVPCYKAGLAGELLSLRERGCAGHPEWRSCFPDSLARRRCFLERDCSVSSAR